MAVVANRCRTPDPHFESKMTLLNIEDSNPTTLVG